MKNDDNNNLTNDENILNDNENIKQKIKKELEGLMEEVKGFGIEELAAKLPIPEAFSMLIIGVTLRKLMDEIEKDDELKDLWEKYQDLLKIKFFESDKKFKEDLIAGYNLDAGNKTIPNISFNLPNNEKLIKAWVDISKIRKKEMEDEEKAYAKKLNTHEEE